MLTITSTGNKSRLKLSSARANSSTGLSITIVQVVLTLTKRYSVYSRSISFFSLCLTQWGVDDCGQPMRVWSQKEQTEASRVKARSSESMDLPGLTSSSVSKSVWYSIKYALINTVSSISTGRSLTDVYSNKLQHHLDFNLLVRSFHSALIYTILIMHRHLLIYLTAIFIFCNLRRL